MSKSFPYVYFIVPCCTVAEVGSGVSVHLIVFGIVIEIEFVALFTLNSTICSAAE